jgi:hypothetical protein
MTFEQKLQSNFYVTGLLSLVFGDFFRVFFGTRGMVLPVTLN